MPNQKVTRDLKTYTKCNTPYRYLSAITGHHTGFRKIQNILTPQLKSDCCMTSIVQAQPILGLDGNRDKQYC